MPGFHFGHFGIFSLLQLDLLSLELGTVLCHIGIFLVLDVGVGFVYMFLEFGIFSQSPSCCFSALLHQSMVGGRLVHGSYVDWLAGVQSRSTQK